MKKERLSKKRKVELREYAAILTEKEADFLLCELISRKGHSQSEINIEGLKAVVQEQMDNKSDQGKVNIEQLKAALEKQRKAV